MRNLPSFAVVALASAGCILAPPEESEGASASAVETARPSLTVMTYNIMQLDVGDWDQARRLAALPDAIRSMNDLPDVIAFEEVFTDAAYAAIWSLSRQYPHITPVVGLKCTGSEWDSTQGNCSKNPLVKRGGVVIASKWPIEKRHQLVFRSAGSYDTFANKGAAYVRIVKGGARYHVIGAHLQSDDKDLQFTDPTKFSQHDAIRVAQLKEISEWLGRLQVPTAEPVIVAGDFNIPYTFATSRKAALDALNADLLFNANDGVNGKDYGSFSADSSQPNWMTRATTQYFTGRTCQNEILDYVVALRDYLPPSRRAAIQIVPLKAAQSWQWSYLRELNDCFGRSFGHDGTHRDLSDHYPVFATFFYER
jgi:phospholipase C